MWSARPRRKSLAGWRGAGWPWCPRCSSRRPLCCGRCWMALPGAGTSRPCRNCSSRRRWCSARLRRNRRSRSGCSGCNSRLCRGRRMNHSRRSTRGRRCSSRPPRHDGGTRRGAGGRRNSLRRRRCGLRGDASSGRSGWRGGCGRLCCRWRCSGWRRRTRGPRLRSLCLCFLFRFRRRFRGSQTQEVLAHKFGFIEVERARVRLLIVDADLRQKVDQDFRFDLEFPCQLVDADLIGICHSPLSF